jgi:5-methylcytosine-specific restriction protein A
MSTLPRPCLEPGCGRLTRSGSRCREHASGWQRRPSAGTYGWAWTKLRAQVLREEPYCRQCGAPSTEVDHIVGKARGGTDNRSNLQGICHRCHARKTRRDR